MKDQVNLYSLTTSVIVSISFSASHGSPAGSSVGIGSLLGSVRATVSGCRWVPLAFGPSWIPGIAGIVPTCWNSHVSVCWSWTNSSSASSSVSIGILDGLIGRVTGIYEGNSMDCTRNFPIRTQVKVYSYTEQWLLPGSQLTRWGNSSWEKFFPRYGFLQVIGRWRLIVEWC